MPTFELADLKAGTVVVVPFPYADRLAEKRRPALVVSNNRVAAQGFVWIAMITSIGRGDPDSVLAISDHAAVGLSHRSYVRPTKIACVEPGRILRIIGNLPAADATIVFDRLHSFIGTPDPGPAGNENP